MKRHLPVNNLNLRHIVRCNGIAKVMGSNPVQARIFSSGLIFTTSLVVFITVEIAFRFIP